MFVQEVERAASCEGDLLHGGQRQALPTYAAEGGIPNSLPASSGILEVVQSDRVAPLDRRPSMMFGLELSPG